MGGQFLGRRFALNSVAAIAAVLALAFSGLVALPTPASAATTTTASSLPSLLTVRTESNASSYDRALFQHWVDADGDGCDTRREVLIEESITPVTIGSGCSISGGQWYSPYDDTTWTDPADVDIDHVVPLAEAWRSGAWSWTAAERRAFANDLEVAYALIAVTDSVNQSKGDKDPAKWMPPFTGYHCQYLIDWALVKYRYSLTVDAAELTTLTSGLSGACGATTVTLPPIVVEEEPPGPEPEPGPEISIPSGISRLAGSDRYETAIKVSKKYPAGVSAVFIATGTNFPDALSGAAAAALLGGPLLLTKPTALPSSVEKELTRLKPSVIYVLGSTSAVSSSVEKALKKIAPVKRYGGSDRYETGLKVVNGVFASSEYAFIATGKNFPDALAATGAAGSLGAPVILVDGTKKSVPSSVIKALKRMGVTKIAIAGSSKAVSSGIQSQLKSLGYSVKRYSGDDRYATTAAINNAFFPAGSVETIFLATGTNFPDALAGAALAGRLAVPMYVTTTKCVPAVIHSSRNTLKAPNTVVLGDAKAVSDNAAKNKKCSTSSSTKPSSPSSPSKPSNPGDSKNCSDFSTWSQAQDWYLKYYPYYGDIAKLDADKDGIACESLPGAP